MGNQCNLASNVPICGNQNRQDLVDSWRAKGKKVILSFGGAGMGGSWLGDTNNCWDYCFGKEDQLSTDLTGIIATHNFDGIDIDYEYCYDVAGKQSGNCPQRTSLYSDEKAQTFLDTLTSNLRRKGSDLQVSNEYNRGRYEITHAPMDSDLVPSNGFASQYFRILKDRRADLDFLMPQFYNGVTRPGLDGVDGTGAGAMSAAVMFSSLANDLFDQEPHKAVFGFCISDCSGTGSNISSDAAVEVTTVMDCGLTIWYEKLVLLLGALLEVRHPHQHLQPKVLRIQLIAQQAQTHLPERYPHPPSLLPRALVSLALPNHPPPFPPKVPSF